MECNFPCALHVVFLRGDRLLIGMYHVFSSWCDSTLINESYICLAYLCACGSMRVSTLLDSCLVFPDRDVSSLPFLVSLKTLTCSDLWVRGS